MLSSHFVGSRKEVQHVEWDDIDERSSSSIIIRFVIFLFCCLVPLFPMDVSLVAMIRAVCRVARSHVLMSLPDEPLRLMFITFSQLKAILRISEAVAKITLFPIVQPHHVEESIWLFKRRHS